MRKIYNLNSIAELDFERNDKRGCYDIYRRGLPFLMNVAELAIYEEQGLEPIFWILVKSSKEFRILNSKEESVTNILTLRGELASELAIELEVRGRYLTFYPSGMKVESSRCNTFEELPSDSFLQNIMSKLPVALKRAVC